MAAVHPHCSLVSQYMNIPEVLYPLTIAKHRDSFWIGANMDRATVNILLFIFWRVCVQNRRLPGTEECWGLGWRVLEPFPFLITNM